MIVLDASGLLCFLHDETGNDIVANALPDTAVSAVNWSEVIQKSWKKELPPMGCATNLKLLALPFSTEDAETVRAAFAQKLAIWLVIGRPCVAKPWLKT
jgi:PIN domain nuclease of toxin-antitoxin system